MLCCGSKKKPLPTIEDEDIKETIRNAQDITGFKEEELYRYYYSFKNLSRDGILDNEGFNKLMMLMGIRISKGIEARIYKAILRTRNSLPSKTGVEGIDFAGLMLYFYNILSTGEQGEASRKLSFEIKLWFMMLDSPQKNYVTGADLESFLTDMEADELADIHDRGPDDIDENDVKEMISNLASSIFEDMEKDFDAKIDLSEFERILKNNEQVMDIFRGFGTSIANLLDVQGQNKYTMTVKVLDEVKTKFYQLVISSKEMRDILQFYKAQSPGDYDEVHSQGSYKQTFSKKGSLAELIEKRKMTDESTPKRHVYVSKLSDLQGIKEQTPKSHFFRGGNYSSGGVSHDVQLDHQEVHRGGFSAAIAERDKFKPKPVENMRVDLMKTRSNNVQVPIIEGYQPHLHANSSPSDKIKAILQQDKAGISPIFEERSPKSGDNYVYVEHPVVEAWHKNKENFKNGIEYLAYLSKMAAVDPSTNGRII